MTDDLVERVREAIWNAARNGDDTAQAALAVLKPGDELPSGDEVVSQGAYTSITAVEFACQKAAEQMRERCAQIAEAIDSKRGNEAEIVRAIRTLPLDPDT